LRTNNAGKTTATIALPEALDGMFVIIATREAAVRSLRRNALVPAGMIRNRSRLVMMVTVADNLIGDLNEPSVQPFLLQ
jgi:hypothetical protein